MWPKRSTEVNWGQPHHKSITMLNCSFPDESDFSKAEQRQKNPTRERIPKLELANPIMADAAAQSKEIIWNEKKTKIEKEDKTKEKRRALDRYEITVVVPASP